MKQTTQWVLPAQPSQALCQKVQNRPAYIPKVMLLPLGELVSLSQTEEWKNVAYSRLPLGGT